MMEARVNEVERAIEKARSAVRDHPKRELLLDLDTMLSMALEEARRLKARKIL